MDSVKYRKLETIMLKVLKHLLVMESQRMALRNVGIEFKVVGISEIEGDVIKFIQRLYIVIF